ncbi:hypothetical protein B0H17DRAFT_1105403, partial [Mycena rosella]
AAYTPCRRHAHLNRRPYLVLRVGRLSMAPRILSAAITLLLALAVACAAVPAPSHQDDSINPLLSVYYRPVPVCSASVASGSFHLHLAKVSFRSACVGAAPP